ncbi:selenoprotein F, partial [Pogonomyrmex barbatus]|uniref:Selenoprotein F n=1 Tax=Pogonomyrmex barbatus TaxID=144034 RepID=A0A8N1S687_9HYME
IHSLFLFLSLSMFVIVINYSSFPLFRPYDIFLSAFIKSDRPKKYKNLSIKYVRGLDPIIKLYDAENRVEDVLDIHKWDTDSVDEFLSTHLSKD